MRFAEKAAEMFPGLVMGKVALHAQAQTPVLPSANGPSAADDDVENRPMFQARDLVDLEYAKRKGDAKRAAKRGTQNAASTASPAAIEARITRDPALVQLLMHAAPAAPMEPAPPTEPSNFLDEKQLCSRVDDLASHRNEVAPERGGSTVRTRGPFDPVSPRRSRSLAGLPDGQCSQDPEVRRGS
ncbi:MAG: hypothetical protein WKG01_01765 [Kofleriaceae bacterium]